MNIKQPAWAGFLLLMVSSVGAQPFEGITVDSLSFSLGQGQGDADIYRIGMQNNWSRSWFSEGDWHVSGYWNLEAGHWHSNKRGGHEDNVFELALTPVFRLEQKSANTGHYSPYLEGGIGLHLIGPTSIGDRSLSSAFQLGSHVGAGIRFGEQGKYDLGYRYQHISNSSLDQPNDGLDLHTISFGMNY